MLTTTPEQYLEALVAELAISESRYTQACNSYQSLGKWLHRDASQVRQYQPQVYVQGSFRLGTAIRPLDDSEEYDVDSVCEFRTLGMNAVSQETLKAMLGREVKAYHDANGMVKPVREGRRCWILDYADDAQFHMDVVPALPNGNQQRLLLEQYRLDARFSETAIVITDKNSANYRQISNQWPRSNPKGYAEWFKQRMGTPFQKRRRVLAEQIRASVEDVPEYKLRTPLQAAVMLLKRHRDGMFINHADVKPISVIITTLAARAYADQESIADALSAILQTMDQYIQRSDNGRILILNPTDPLENFADKWAEDPRRADAFFQWLEQARKDFEEITRYTNRQIVVEGVRQRMGRAASRAAAKFAPTSTGLLRAATATSATAAATPAFPSQRREPTTPKGFA